MTGMTSSAREEEHMLPAFGSPSSERVASKQKTAAFGSETATFGVSDFQVAPDVKKNISAASRFSQNMSVEVSEEAACDDELDMASPSCRIFALAEQLTEFLNNGFSLPEQQEILEPFFDAGTSTLFLIAAEPRIEEARQFVSTYLAAYSEVDRELALVKVRAQTRADMGSDGSPDTKIRTASSDFMDWRRELRQTPAPRRQNFSFFADGATQRQQKIEETFKRYDKRGSGKLARSELVTLLQELNPLLVDKDLDGMLATQWVQDSISYSDFTSWLCR